VSKSLHTSSPTLNVSEGRVPASSTVPRKPIVNTSQELLEDKGLCPARHFHGGTAGARRRDLLREFRTSKKMVMVATDAFGLGVDKPDVRWVLHFSLPASNRPVLPGDRKRRSGWQALRGVALLLLRRPRH